MDTDRVTVLCVQQSFKIKFVHMQQEVERNRGRQHQNNVGAVGNGAEKDECGSCRHKLIYFTALVMISK